MKFQRLASTLAAAAIAGGGVITMGAVTAAPAHADGGGSFGHHGFGDSFGFAAGGNLCVAKSVKKYVKKRGGGKFGRYFGGHRRYVVKKVAKRYVRCASAHRRAHKIRHHRFGHHGFGHKGFDHKGIGHKGFDHKGFGHHKGFDKWDW